MLVLGITTRITYKKGLDRAFFWIFVFIVNIDKDSSRLKSSLLKGIILNCF